MKKQETDQGPAAPGTATHTPGPWEPCGHFIRTARSTGAGVEVARVDFTASHFDAATRTANIQLIAAAPTMAHGLEQAAKYLRGNAPVEMALDAIDYALRAAGRLP